MRPGRSQPTAGRPNRYKKGLGGGKSTMSRNVRQKTSSAERDRFVVGGWWLNSSRNMLPYEEKAPKTRGGKVEKGVGGNSELFAQKTSEKIPVAAFVSMRGENLRGPPQKKTEAACADAGSAA